LGKFSRSQCREWALQFLYQAEFAGPHRPEALEQFWGHFGPLLILRAVRPRSTLMGLKNIGLRVGPVRPIIQVSLKKGAPPVHLKDLAQGVTAHVEELDVFIVRYSEHWRLERMTIVDRNLLRLATYELLYQPRIPVKVVINEAVEMAKRYGSEASGGFVNGILDQVRMSVGREV
jgi:transcription antitermination factor NusB